ncbi:MAG TPA: hypothetical protein PK566_08130 [Pseudobacteroides sp.]|nr:hypothetical protein [Pseudobacteroides sp.]
MGSEVLFLNMQYENGLYAAKTSENIKNIQSSLKAQKIRNMEYEEAVIGNLPDFADEIISEGYENIAMHVDAHNIRLCEVITKELKKLDDQTRIIWFGDWVASIYEKALVNCQVDVCVVNKIEESLISLLTTDDLKECSNIAYLSDDKVLVNNCISSEIVVEEKQINSSTKNDDAGYFSCMTNGIIASETGLYPQNVLGAGTKHVYAEKMLSEQDLEYLKDYTSVNSAIIQRNADESSELYNETLRKAEQVNYFASHYHQAAKNGKGEFIKLDDSDKAIKVAKVGYSKYRSGDAEIYKDGINFIKIEEEKDIEAFIDSINYFRTTGKFNTRDLWIKIQDECRWSVAGICSLKNLARFTLTGEGDIKPCGGCNKCVGNIKSSPMENIRNIYKMSDKDLIERGCNECPIKESCSKCIMIPDFMDNDVYCEIRRSNPEIPEYLIKKSILEYLLTNSKTLRDTSPEDFKFSTSYITHLFPMKGDSKNSIVEGYIHLFYVNNSPMLFEAVRNNILKIENELAFIIEGCMRGETPHSISEEYVKKFQVTDSDAMEAVENSITMLKNQGFIRRNI